MTSKKKSAAKKSETAVKPPIPEALPIQDWSMVVPPEAAGWIPPENRTDESKKIHKQFLEDVPTVSEAFTSPGYVKDRPRAWQLVAEAIKKNWIPKEFLRNGQLKNIAQIIGSCFPAGTLVRMADGSEKPIEEIRVGDEVVSHTGQSRRVINTFRRDYTGDLVAIVAAGRKLVSTKDHRIWARCGSEYFWEEAQDLTTQATVVCPGKLGIESRVDSIESVNDSLTVYDIEVEEDHSFIANGIAVHNCVGFGAGNMLFWASLIDAICRKQKDRIMVPFVPYHYGRGRLHSGIRGPGSGSFGSGQAKALQLDGFLAFDQEGVPKPTFGDAIYWTQGIEYEWSDGARIPEKFIQQAKNNLCRTVARVTNTDEAAQLADNWYSFTCASSYGGKMQCPIVKGVLLNSHVGTWNHQMWSPDYIIHPELGRLWWIGNNWRYPHGKDLGGPWDGNTGAPEGGFYITDKDMQWILSKQDSFAFADPQGFEDRSRAFDWVMV